MPTITHTPVDIAVFVPMLAGGGAERVMALLVVEWQRQGFRTELVLCRRAGPYLSELPADFPIHELGTARVTTGLRPLVGYLRHRQPRAMVSTLTHANLIALAAKKLSGAHVRLVLREANTLSAIRPDSWSIRQRAIPLLARRYYRTADAVVAPSRGVAEDLTRNFGIDPSRVHVIHNPSLVFPTQSDPPHPWLTDGQPPVILGVGRLVPQKDFSTLLRAFTILRHRKTTRLLILGEGPERDSLETLAKELGVADNVELCGFVSNPGAYLSRASLFTLSSAWEGLPNVILQALAVGCPVVSTDCRSGPSEILEDGRFGRLVPINDPPAMAAAMAAMLIAPTSPELLLDRAADFTLADIARQYLDVLLPKYS